MSIIGIIGSGLVFLLFDYVCDNVITLKGSASSKLTGTLHSLIQIPIALIAIRDKTIWDNRFFAITASSTLIMEISSGYFLYDLISCIRNFRRDGVYFLIHAIGCFTVYLTGTLFKCLHFYGVCFILWELSTPFLHARWFMFKLKITSHLRIANDIIFFLMFFSCRIVWGFIVSLYFWNDIHIFSLQDNDPATLILHRYMLFILVVLHTTLNSLNIIWFSTMIRKITKS